MNDTLKTTEQLLEELRQAQNALSEMKSHESALEQAQEALKESEQLLYGVLEGSPIPAFVIGRNHRIIYWNKALQELTKIQAKDVIGTNQHWRAFYRQERPSLADILLDQKAEEIPHWYGDKCRKSKLIEEAYEATDFFAALGKGGKWLRFTAAVIRDPAGNLRGAVETLEDITERRRAEEELLRMQKLESLSKMAEGVAQEFNSLLSGILGKVVWAKLSTGEENSGMEEVLSLAEKFGHQAKELTHQLLAFSTGRTPNKTPFLLSPMIREETTVLLQNSKVVCQFSLPENLWLADIDAVQIRRVIRDLIQHALNEMADGGILAIRAENTTVADNEPPLTKGRYVKLTFRDNGTGMSPEELQNLFQPYSSPRRGGPEKGLGLALCYSIVRKHDGWIRAESKEGQGTSLEVWLQASREAEPATGEATAPALFRDRRLLMQDVSEKVRSASDIILNFLHYQAEFTSTAQETIERYAAALNEKQPYSAVMIAWSEETDADVRHTMVRLREADRNVRILLVVDSQDATDETSLIQAGASGLITKPLGVEDAGEALRNLLR